MSVESQLRAIAQKRMQDVSEIARAAIIRVGNRIVTASPVADGNFINRWNTSINTISYEMREGESKSGDESIKQLNEEVSDLRLGTTAYFNNPSPQGPRIEYEGWSHDKAPNGMVRINTALWESIVNEEIEKRK